MSLSKTEKNHFKGKLLLLKQEILNDQEADDNTTLSLSDFAGELSSMANHFADIATALEQREKDIAIDQAMHQRLHDINQALKLLEEDKYGICIDTDERISKERLEAVPYAIRTIEAQKKYENKHKNTENEQEKTFTYPDEQFREDTRIRTVDNLLDEHGNSSMQE